MGPLPTRDGPIRLVHSEGDLDAILEVPAPVALGRDISGPGERYRVISATLWDERGAA